MRKIKPPGIDAALKNALFVKKKKKKLWFGSKVSKTMSS